MPFPFTFPFCFDGSVCPEYWVPSLGGLDLERILDLSERKRTTLPRKGVYHRSGPSTEAGTYSDFPNEHILLCRLTDVELTTLQDMENDLLPHNLYQIQGDPAIVVWIENIDVGYAMREHNQAFWLVTIHLVEV